jgi:ATP-dependent DNA helicase 2 subunit 1
MKSLLIESSSGRYVSKLNYPPELKLCLQHVLLPGSIDPESEVDEMLPESLSITRITNLLDEMRFYEIPKRAHFNVNLMLADNFVIGVQGYSLVTEQKKGAYKYFADLGDRMEVAGSKMYYIDEVSIAEYS